MRMEFVQVGDILTRYYVAGCGPHIVLVHGVGMTADVWLRNLEELSADHTVLAPDLVGCGFTGGMTPADTPPLDMMVDHLDAFMDVLDVQRAVLIGSSLGGWVAVLEYFRNVERVQGLFLVGCETVLGGSAKQIRDLARRSLENGRSSFGDHSLEGTRDRMARLVVDADCIPEAVCMLQHLASALPMAQESFEHRLLGLCAIGRAQDLLVLDRLPSIDVPVSIVSGDSDVRGDSELLRRVAEAIQCEPSVLENCGHLPQIEKPTLFNSLVREFLTSLHQAPK